MEGFYTIPENRTPRSAMQQVLKNANVGFTHAEERDSILPA
jgi:hypothetical protein